LAERVEDGVTGVLFERGEVESLGRCLSRLAEDDRLVTRLSEEAYRRFCEARTRSNYGEHSEQVYREVGGAGK
jgi:glycosyltransferase involved in cell wall biosynthesis